MALFNYEDSAHNHPGIIALLSFTTPLGTYRCCRFQVQDGTWSDVHGYWDYLLGSRFRPPAICTRFHHRGSARPAHRDMVYIRFAQSLSDPGRWVSQNRRAAVTLLLQLTSFGFMVNFPCFSMLTSPIQQEEWEVLEGEEPPTF